MAAPDAHQLTEACEVLAAKDTALARAYAEIGLPTWRETEASYQTLARIVVYQLISTKAADAIWARILARYPDMTAAAVLQDDQEALRACGLSRPKLAHLNSIAMAIEGGTLDLNALAAQPIDTARQQLLSVKGIGPWSADTFLMNALGHLDAFPTGDVGLMEAHKRLNGLKQRLTAKTFHATAENWRPYRSVAAHLLYDWYNSNRNK
nr:DNA-3-methyladenine glycosylase [Hyphomonas sp. Mor2]